MPTNSAPRPFRSVASRMRPAHYDAVRACADAELRGDAATAFERHRSVPLFRDSAHGDLLQVLAELGDDAPGWLVSRWLTVQSRRRLWTGGDGDQGDAALRIVVPAVYPDHIPFETIGCEHPEQVMAWIHVRDWIVRQVDVYELGHLRALLEDAASPQILARADRVDDWCDAPMGGYQVEGAADGVLHLVDLADDTRLDVLDLGLFEQADHPSHVIGRIVPVSAAPGRMFESRPLAVSPGTAAAVAASPIRWVLVLRMKVRAGREPLGFSQLPCDTSLTADLPCHSWLTLVGGDPVVGVRHHVADLAEQALDEALRLAHDEPEALTTRRHRIAELLLDVELPAPVCLARATAEHQVAWQRLTDVVRGPAQARCQTMLLWSDAAGAA